MVPIPDGLDLDEWFVPPPPEPVAVERTDSGEKKVKKSKKGKERQGNGKKEKKTKKGVKDVSLDVPGVTLTPTTHDEVETPEEIAERERVRSFTILAELRS